MATSEIAASAFKTRCLELMDQVANSRTEIVVTKRGRPFVKLVPVADQKPEIFGFLKGSVTIHGDITAPLDKEWEANG